jgi:ubiquinone biosynthesis protein
VSRGETARKVLEQLGPIFVKFGQVLSTRPDILPADLALELAKLQDNVPPFSSALAIKIIEETFNQPVSTLFAEFNSNVLASASIAQVHAARLHSGEEVVVKILRPNIEKKIKQDLNVMYTIAYLAEHYWVKSKRFKPQEMVAEFEKTLLSELDLQREAANASQLKRNFKSSTELHIPTIYWDYVRDNICVMERIYGISITDIPALKAHGIDTKRLAELGVTLFFTQVFRDCFFHADMHPGNIFISPHHPHNPQYICVDFGIMGTLSDSDQRYIAENLLAFFNRDYKRVATLHIESGWIPRNTCIEEFESAIRTVCEPIFEKPLKDISFGLIVLKLFQVARRFQMNIQPQLILLQKTLLAVEGLARQLHPELDLWATAKPYLEKWLASQIGVRALLTHWRQNVPFLIEQLPYMPRLLNDVLTLTREQQLRQLEQAPPKVKNKSRGFLIGLTLGILSGIILTLLFKEHPWG